MKANQRLSRFIVAASAFALFCTATILGGQTPAWGFRDPGPQAASPGLALDSTPRPPRAREANVIQNRMVPDVLLPGNPKTESAIENALRDYVRDNPSLFGGITQNDLRLDYLKILPGAVNSAYANFVQIAGGLDVDGGGVTFTVQVDSTKTLIQVIQVHLFPDAKKHVQTHPGKDKGAQNARRRLAPAMRNRPMSHLGAKIRWIKGKWRAVDEFGVDGTGLRAATDDRGETVLWDDRRYASVTGSVKGRGVLFNPAATGGNLAELLLKDLKVQPYPGVASYTNDYSYYAIDFAGGSMEARLSGKYAKVLDAGGTDFRFWYNGGSNWNIVFNPTGNSDIPTSQVNAYYHVNEAHKWLNARIPDQRIDRAIPIFVNVNDACNAFYNRMWSTLNFVAAGTDEYGRTCINMAYDTVIYHEYGHFVDDMIGGIPYTGGGLSEGWGDVLATYITGQPLLGEGLPAELVRTADNYYLYYSTDEIHDQGNAWAGFAWDLRKSIIAKTGSPYAAESLMLRTMWRNSPDIPTAVLDLAAEDSALHWPGFNAEILAAAEIHKLDFVFDSMAPSVSLAAPSGGTLSGIVTLTASASDNWGLGGITFQLDGIDLGPFWEEEIPATPFSASWSTSTKWNSGLTTNGPHTLTAVARDANGNRTVSAPVTVTVSNVMAVYDPINLKAPWCSAAANTCPSGNLLAGKSITEVYQPNTIHNSCADGTHDPNQFHIEGITVGVLNGSKFSPGTTVRIDVTESFADWGLPYADLFVDLYTATNANAPNWTYLTTLTPAWPVIMTGKPETLSATYVLPPGDLQAIRAKTRQGIPTGYWSPNAGSKQSPTSFCDADVLEDHDDLVFAVAPPAPDLVVTAVSAATAVVLGSGNVFDLLKSATTGVVGGNLYVKYGVTNLGTAAASSSYLKFYLAPIPGDSSKDIPVGLQYVPALNAGSSAGGIFTTSILPVTLSPGTYYVRAVADGYNSVQELDDANNSLVGGPITIVADTILPTVSITAPAQSAGVSWTLMVKAAASDNARVSGVQFKVDGANLGSEVRASVYAMVWDTTLVSTGPHTLTAVARDPSGNLGVSAPAVVFVANAPGNAVLAPSLKAPRCSSAAGACDSGSLLNGRGAVNNVSGAAESNQPNTINGSCADGNSPYRAIAIERMKISASDGGNLAAGKTVKIDIGVSAWTNDAVTGRLDLYAAADAASPTWTFLGTLVPTTGRGGETLSTTYTLPSGDLQAVRANLRDFRDSPAAAFCTSGRWDDHDDLVFAVDRFAAAAFDPALKAPKCSSAGSSCDSGGLLTGRGTLSGGVEPEFTRPNNIYASCADGNAGTFHSDESLDRLRVSSLDGGPLTAGKAAKIEAAVWAWAGYSADKLDLYYAADANSPRWTFLTTLTPATSGQQTLSTTYTLPYDGTALQAVRANFRYYGSASACTAGSFDDHDDLVFAAVRGGATPAGSGGSAVASRELTPLPPLTAAQKAGARSSGLVLIGRTLDAPGSGARDGAVDSETIPAERREGVGERPRTLSAPVTIGFPYRESDLPEGVKEADLRLYVWQPEEGRWVEAAQARQDPERDEFELTTNQPGDYRIFAREPGPSPQAAFGLGEVYAYPNPARGGVRPVIRAELGVAEKVEIKIYNLAGELVHAAELASAPALIGGRYVYEYPWDASRNPSGVYIYVVRAWQGGQAVKAAKKLALIK